MIRHLLMSDQFDAYYPATTNGLSDTPPGVLATLDHTIITHGPLSSSNHPHHILDGGRAVWRRNVGTFIPQARDIKPAERNQILNKLPQEVDQNSPQISTSWARFESELRHNLLNSDFESFLRWSVVEQTMSVPPTSPWVKFELQYLRKHPDWHTKWKAALVDSAVGNPRPYRRFPSASANLIHQAYQISHFESTTGMAIVDYGSILEIGGGFGAACRLINRLGGTRRYEIFDLPTLSVLQNLYLTAVGLIDPFVDEDVRVRTVSTTGYDAGPEPSHAPELLIASWSLSETPMQFR